MSRRKIIAFTDNLPEYISFHLIPVHSSRLLFQRALTTVVSANDEVRMRTIYAMRALSANTCISESSPETCSQSSWSRWPYFFFSPVNCCPACGKKVVLQSIAGSDHHSTYSYILLFSLPFWLTRGRTENSIDRRGKVRRTNLNCRVKMCSDNDESARKACARDRIFRRWPSSRFSCIIDGRNCIPAGRIILLRRHLHYAGVHDARCTAVPDIHVHLEMNH